MWDNVTENKARLSGSGFKISKCNKIELISITKFHKDLNSNNLMIPTLITNSMLNCQRNPMDPRPPGSSFHGILQA